MPIQANVDEWRKAIECAQRSGQVPAAVARAALAKLANEKASSLGSDVISTWLGLPVEPCERLLDLAKAIKNAAASPLRMTTPTPPGPRARPVLRSPKGEGGHREDGPAG